jgi:hypothetical protein
MTTHVSRRQPPIATAQITSPRVAERGLLALGCDPAFVADLLGDLTEEYANRTARDGVGPARWWYAREAVRSAPHLVWSAIRHGTPQGRARLAAYVAACVLTFSVAAMVWLARNGPPARLVADESDGIVVNNLLPVQLSMHAFDAGGHRLERTDVRYQWVSGAPIPVSVRGVVTCTHRGNAVVRATLGPLGTHVVIHCQPVRALRGASWGNFVLGDSARTLELEAIGLDGRPVTRIAARLRVRDSTVATLDGGRLLPLRPGSTGIDVEVGDQRTSAKVTVFELVRTFEGLRPDQRWVVASVHLLRGASVRWPLPVGLFFLTLNPGSTEGGFATTSLAHWTLTLSVAGPIMCMPALGPGVVDTHCLARGAGATLTIAHPGSAAPEEVGGMIALERQEQR